MNKKKTKKYYAGIPRERNSGIFNGFERNFGQNPKSISFGTDLHRLIVGIPKFFHAKFILGRSYFAGQGESAMDSGKRRWIIAQLCRQAPENRRHPGTGGMRL